MELPTWAAATSRSNPTSRGSKDTRPLGRKSRVVDRLPSCEAHGSAASWALLHVDDPVVAVGQHVVTLVSEAVGIYPLRRADELVATNLGEPLLEPERSQLYDLCR
jgi:hypothetical protein